MASNPSISLPQIPKDIDPALQDYLTALTKVITSKQIDDYSKAEKDNSDISDQITSINEGLVLYSSILGADVAVAVANTWYTGATLTLLAGEYLLVSHITLNRATTTALVYSAKICSGSINYASGGDYRASVANNIVTIPLTAKVVLTEETTITLQATASQTAVIKASLVTNASGTTATQLNAVRIR